MIVTTRKYTDMTIEQGLSELDFNNLEQVGEELWIPLRESYVNELKQAYLELAEVIE
jgi:hypothetical protein